MEWKPENQQPDILDENLKQLYSISTPPSFEERWLTQIKREERINQMKKKSIWQWKGWKTAVLPVAAALVLLVGAGWAGNIDWEGESLVSSKEAPVGAYSRTNTYGATEEPAMDYSADSGEYLMADSASAAGGMTGTTAAPKMADSTADTTQRKLIRTVTLTMRTGNYETDLQAIRQLVATAGGYEEYHYESGDASNGDARYVEMTLRIPADQLDTFLGGVNGVARVVNRSENTVDMTTQYSDNQTRLNTLNVKMTRLNELLAEAESIEDILAIETKITDTQYEIDILTGTQINIDRQVDMSTVHISMKEDKPSEITPEMTFGQKLSRALKGSWEGFGEFLRNALLFIIMALPALITIGVVVLVIILIRKAVKKRSGSGEEAVADEADESEE